MSVARDKDLYELFELERYSGDDLSLRFQAQVGRKYRSLALRYHPDKCAPENKTEYEVIFKYIKEGHDILLDPDAKRRYDHELRRTRKEENGWDAFRWWGRWVFNATLIGGGIGLIIGGLLSAIPTAGSGLAMSIAGSSMLSAGIRGAASHYNDPDQSNYDYLKQLGIGALTGAAGGAIGGACAGAIQGASVAAQIGIAAAGGAGTGLANHVIEDGVNLADGTVSHEELLTLEHAASIGKSVAIGACAGMAVQGVASALQGGAKQSQQIVDDAATAAISTARKVGKAGAVAAALKAQESVKGALKAATTVGKFVEGAGAKLLANTAGTAVQCSGDAAETSVRLYLKGEANLGDSALQVAKETATTFFIGTAVSTATALVAQGVEHGKAVSLLHEMERPPHVNDTGHAKERHLCTLEAAEARTRVNDELGTPQAASFFESSSQYDGAIDMPTSSKDGNITVTDAGKTVGGSVKCKNGKFEYRECTQTKVVHNGNGKVLTAYPVHSAGKIVDRIPFSTPFLRPLPSLPFNEVIWVHHSSRAGRSHDVCCNAWSSWACQQERSRPLSFLPCTRFLTPQGPFITAASLRVNGGDVCVGPAGLHITVKKAIKHPSSQRALVSVLTEGMTRPFEVTAEHRLVVEGVDGKPMSMEACMLADEHFREDCSLEERPKVYNGYTFASIVEANQITRDTDVVQVQFTNDDDDVVLAWFLAAPRSSRRRHRSLPCESAVACYGAKMQAIDRIRGLWDAGEFQTPGRNDLLERNTFLEFHEEAGEASKPRSLSAGMQARHPSQSWSSKGSRSHREDFPDQCEICQPHRRHLQDPLRPPCMKGSDCHRCHMPH